MRSGINSFYRVDVFTPPTIAYSAWGLFHKARTPPGAAGDSCRRAPRVARSFEYAHPPSECKSRLGACWMHAAEPCLALETPAAECTPVCRHAPRALVFRQPRRERRTAPNCLRAEQEAIQGSRPTLAALARGWRRLRLRKACGALGTFFAARIDSSAEPELQEFRRERAVHGTAATRSSAVSSATAACRRELARSCLRQSSDLRVF